MDVNEDQKNEKMGWGVFFNNVMYNILIFFGLDISIILEYWIFGLCFTR